MLFPRSSENQLLLACARIVTHTQKIQQSRKMQELVRLSLDWRRIVEKAVQYGVAPLLYSNLKQVPNNTQVPVEIMEQLKGSYLWHAVKNNNIYHKISEITETFSQEMIPVIILKGAALAWLCYKDVALRPMRDLDLLVRRKDLDAADQLLRKLGYVPGKFPHSEEWYRAYHHHLAPYFSGDGSLILELHHHIICPTASLDIPIEDFWQRARSTQITSLRVLIFAPEDLLIHTCLHLSHDNHFLRALIGLRDVAEIVTYYKEEIDWDKLLRKAQTYEIQKHLYYALWMSQNILEAEVPNEILT
jgi:hypothetical protein